MSRSNGPSEHFTSSAMFETLIKAWLRLGRDMVPTYLVTLVWRRLLEYALARTDNETTLLGRGWGVVSSRKYRWVGDRLGSHMFL